MIVQISAGQGPSECQLAVAKLFEALQKEYGDLVEISKNKGYETVSYTHLTLPTILRV